MAETEHDRIREAYLAMAKEARYRPQAPSDGMGTVMLSKEQIKDEGLLEKEASEYATRFIEEEDSRTFHIGVSSYSTNRAFAYTIEAARLLCGIGDSPQFARKLLEMAIEEIKNIPEPVQLGA